MPRIRSYSKKTLCNLLKQILEVIQIAIVDWSDAELFMPEATF